MKNDFLPIGSVITVDNTDVMICSYFKPDADYNGEKYDYVCCLYPTGIGREAILVKKDNIERIRFIGFQDGKFVELKHRLFGEKNE